MKYIILMLSVVAFSQDRYITHVTRAQGGFETEILVTNQTELDQEFSIQGYDELGNRLGAFRRTINAETTLSLKSEEIFGAQEVSHFKFDSNRGVFASAVYRSMAQGAGPVHVQEAEESARYWIIQTGNWDVAWDGVAIVNTSEKPANVQVNHKVNGSTENQKLIQLAPMSKSLVVLSSDFDLEPDSFFAIASTEPVLVLALRGDNSFRFLWENKAIESADYSTSEKAQALVGNWTFQYKLSTTTFTQTYNMRALTGQTLDDGGYVVVGEDKFGDVVVGSYSPTLREFTLLDTGITISRFFTFRINGNIASGCYYQSSSRGLSNCYSMTGTRSSLKQESVFDSQEEPILAKSVNKSRMERVEVLRNILEELEKK